MLSRLALVRERIKADDMARHGLMMAAFGIATGFFNYLYQLSMGRMLEDDEFGTLSSLVSLFIIVSIFALTIQTAITKFTSRYEAEGKRGASGYVWRFYLKWTLILGAAAFLLAALFSPLVSGFLKIDNLWYPIVLFSALILAFALPVNYGALNGLQRFLPLGLSTTLWAVLRFALAVLLVYLGLGVYGGLVPLLLANVIVFAVTFALLRDLRGRDSERVEFSEFRSYIGLTFIAILAFTMLTNVDVIMVKHYLSLVSPDTADVPGNYAAISVLGRIALFAPAGIAIAMFPKTSGRFEVGISHRPVLLVAMLLTLLLAGVVVVIYWFFPDFVVNLLGVDELGDPKYPLAAPYLFRYGLAMMLFAFSFILMNYFLSLNRTRVVYPFMGVALFQIALIGFFHSNIDQFVNIMLICGAVCLLAMLLFFLKVRLPAPAV